MGFLEDSPEHEFTHNVLRCTGLWQQPHTLLMCYPCGSGRREKSQGSLARPSGSNEHL
jgi:hypothetical protein